MKRLFVIPALLALAACDVMLHIECDDAGVCTAISTPTSLLDATCQSFIDAGADADAADSGDAADVSDSSDSADATDASDASDAAYWFEPIATVAIGDSTTEPYYYMPSVKVSWTDDIPAVYGPVLNMGASGQDCEYHLTAARLPTWTGFGSAYPNRLALVQCGTNNIYHGQTAAEAWAHACDVSAQARTSGFSRTAFATPFRRNWTTEQAVRAAAFADLARAHYADCYDDLADIASDPEMGGTTGVIGPPYFRDIITHPSRQGMDRFWAVAEGPAYWRAVDFYRTH